MEKLAESVHGRVGLTALPLRAGQDIFNLSDSLVNSRGPRLDDELATPISPVAAANSNQTM